MQAHTLSWLATHLPGKVRGRPITEPMEGRCVRNAVAAGDGLTVRDCKFRADWWASPYVVKRFQPTSQSTPSLVKSFEGGFNDLAKALRPAKGPSGPRLAPARNNSPLSRWTLPGSSASVLSSGEPFSGNK
jgi:hypothetical protein